MIARVVAAVCLVATMFTAVPAMASANAPIAERILQVPYRSQLDGNPWQLADCGPASLAMVLAAYGKVVPTMEVRGIVNDLQDTWHEPDAGTFIENIGLIGSRYGLQPIGLFKAPGVYKYEDKMLRRWTIAELRAQLNAGRPVIPQVWYRGLPGRERKAYNGDHFIVITGYQGDDFVFHDPIDKDMVGAERRITTAQLDRAWRNSDFPYAAVALAGPAGRSGVAPLAPVDTAAPPKVIPARRFLAAI